MYIYQNSDWKNFYYDYEVVIEPLGKIRLLQGKIIGMMESFGFELQSNSTLENLTNEVIKNNEIEGEFFDYQEVRSLIAIKLGMDNFVTNPKNDKVEGFVEVLMDAINNFDQPLTIDRLLNWHSQIFKNYYYQFNKITIGEIRTDANGPMQIISGPMGKETVHFEAPPANILDHEITDFLNWYNTENNIDLILKSSIAHLWFLTLHPFEDGNGRLARIISEMTLAKSDSLKQRYYSMSSQINKQRKEYYNILEQTQKGNSDITAWLSWYLNSLLESLKSSDENISKSILKAKFWSNISTHKLNERQIRIINKLLDGFEGNITTSKWAKINKCSQDTALRDIKDLELKNIMLKNTKSGRSTSYFLNEIDSNND